MRRSSSPPEDQNEARVWLRRAHLYLTPASDDETRARLKLEARDELARIVTQGEARGTPPTAIVEQAEAMLAQRGLAHLVPT